MKYRAESFFDKYQIEPNQTIAQLRAIFQSDPNKRKDLPIVIKTISNQQLLFEEELFTEHLIDDSFFSNHAGLLRNVKNLKQTVEKDIIHNLQNQIIHIANNEDKWNLFFYYMGCSGADNIIRDFLTCIYDEIKHEFILGLGEHSAEISSDFYYSLTNLSNEIAWLSRKKDELVDELCDYTDNSLSLDDHSLSFENKIKTLLNLGPIVDDDFFKKSLKFAITKMLDNLDDYKDVLLNLYPQIVKVFSGTELLEISSFIANVADKYVDITCSNKALTPQQVVNGSKKIVDAYDCLKKTGVSLVDAGSGKHVFKVKDMDLYYKNAKFISNAGKVWYEDYRNRLIRLKAYCTAPNMYDLIAHIMKAKPDTETKDLLANIVLGHSDFELLFTFILKCHKETTDKTSSKFIDPQEVDNFISKYYWLIFMVKDSNQFNETMFNNIRNFAFDILSIYSDQMERLNRTYDQSTRYLLANQLKNGLREALQKIPPDYYFDENTRVVDAIKKFEGRHYGSASESSLYIDKYCDLFGKSRNKHGRAAYDNRSQSNSYSGNSNFSSISRSSSGCYIATCVYGSYDCPQVWTLRRFRDFELNKTWYGRLFIKIYYAISPKLVKLFGKTKWFKKLWRKKLDKMVTKCNEKGYLDTPYDDLY